MRATNLISGVGCHIVPFFSLLLFQSVCCWKQRWRQFEEISEKIADCEMFSKFPVWTNLFYSALFSSCIEELSLEQTEQLVWQHADELRKIFEGKVNLYFWRQWWSLLPNRLCVFRRSSRAPWERVENIFRFLWRVVTSENQIFHYQMDRSQQMHTFKWANQNAGKWYMQQALRAGKVVEQGTVG